MCNYPFYPSLFYGWIGCRKAKGNIPRVLLPFIMTCAIMVSLEVVDDDNLELDSMNNVIVKG